LCEDLVGGVEWKEKADAEKQEGDGEDASRHAGREQHGASLGLWARTHGDAAGRRGGRAATRFGIYILPRG
jgi:hypothetical protein